jgi:hypothetical protein
LIHRDYDPSDMEIVNTENKVTSIHDVRYNTVNFSLYLDSQHSDCIVTVESYISYGVQYIFIIVHEYNEIPMQYKCKTTRNY